MDVTQTEYHIHHGTWTTAHQEHGSSLAEEVSAVSQRQNRNRSLKCTLKREKNASCLQEVNKNSHLNVTYRL